MLGEEVAMDDVLITYLDQDSEEWLTWRNSGIGSSDIILLYEPKGYFDRNVFGLWKDRCGFEKFTFLENVHTKRGKALEPEIRCKVNESLSSNYIPRCMERRDKPYLRVSLDGWDSDTDSILEIKSPAESKFRKQLKEKCVPKEYYYQIQYQLLVSDSKYAFYSFWNEQEKDVYTLYVPRDEILIKDIEMRCDIFWGAVQSQTPIGFDGDNLRLYEIQYDLIIRISDGEYKHPLLPTFSDVETFTQSCVYTTSDLSTISEVIRRNPNHKITIESNLPPYIIK